MAAKRKAAENAAIAMAEQASQRKRTKSADSSKFGGTKEKSAKAQADSSRSETTRTFHDNADMKDPSEPAQMLTELVMKRTAMGRIDEEGNATATDDGGISQNTKAVSSRSGPTRSSSRKPMKSASVDLASQQADNGDTSTSVPTSPKPLRRASRPRSKAKLVFAKTPPDVSSDSAKPEESGLANQRAASVGNEPAEDSSRDTSSNPPAKGRKPKSSKTLQSRGSNKMDQQEPVTQKHPADSVAAEGSSTSNDSNDDSELDNSGEFAITVLHSGRPQVKQVYSTISFQGLPDSKIHSAIVRPFCFGHDPSMRKTTENTDKQPNSEEEGEVMIIRPLKKSFLKVSRLTFFAVTGFQPSNQNKESVLRAGPQQKINSITGLPMVDPQSKDFVRDFERAFYSDKGAAEHTEQRREALTSELQTSDDGDSDDVPEITGDSSEVL